MNNHRILVIGADGLVGHGLLNALARSGTSVYGTTRRRPERADYLFLDLADPAVGTIPLPKIDTAVFCAAINGFSACRENPEHAYRVNVTATEALARRLIAESCRIIYLSSSAVFDFRQPYRIAEDSPCPTTLYGKLQAEAEAAILALGSTSTIVRLTKVLTPKTALFAGWLGALARRQTIAAYSDLHFSPISLDFVVAALLRIVGDASGGVYQLSGADDLSYAAAARHFARKMGCSEKLVSADRAAAHGIPEEEIARFTSLEMSRYTALSGQRAPAPLEVLDELFGPQIERLGR